MAKKPSSRETGILKEADGDEAGPIEAALKDPSIPHLYANAVAFAASNGDYCMVVMQNGVSIATLNMSFTVAKSVGVAIGHLISGLETATGQEIMTMDNIRHKMEQQSAKT